jgi:L-seryl-tRNA(Ser) seleniumtransferase
VEGKNLRTLPSVAKLVAAPELAEFPHPIAVDAARQAIDEARRSGLDPGGIPSRAAQIATDWSTPAYRPAINCSGTILNTGLGRARLARAAVDAMKTVGSSHATLEIDLSTGRRGDRQAGLRTLLTKLTGAESALVVNNNAGAVLLVLNSLASGRKVLLSRGQSVEIGGAFRMPDVIRSSGATLVDVGTTNKTKVSDYESASDVDTSVLLRCHPSNFRISGFVEEPTAQELAACAKRLKLTMVDDVGSGSIVSTEKFGLPHEPTIQDSLRAGAQIVTASGDKLLGGPQAGIILGKAKLISRISKNPLARALRIDKVTAAALEATLRLYREGRESEIPTIRYLSRDIDEVRDLADRLAKSIGGESSYSKCEPGGGSLPGVELPSWRVTVPGPATELSAKFRSMPVPVIGYVEGGAFRLDMRCVEEDELDLIARQASEVLS